MPGKRITDYQVHKFNQHRSKLSQAAVAAGHLQPVLTAFVGPQYPVSLVYPSKRLIPVKLRAFLDFAAPQLEKALTDVEAVFGSPP